MIFKLQIELGSEAMKTLSDVAYQLRAIGFSFINDEGEPEPTYHVIRDDNGNNVGSWRIEKQPEE